MDIEAVSDDVLRFWYEEATPKQHFEKDPDFDALVRARFLPLYEDIAANGHERFMGSPETLLAAILVLDQFSRNMFRDDARAFAEDARARALCKHAIDTGMDQQIDRDRRSFVYMPLMHSEDLADHELAVEVMTAFGDERQLEYEIRHKAIIERFGRYPHRNAVLGRDSTAEEEEFHREHGGF